MPSQVEVAQQLAENISRATTSDALYEALLNVMRALRIGVYSPQGVPIVPQQGSAPAEDYLYDFELRLMAKAYENGKLWGIDDIVQTLNTANVTQGDGTPLDREIMQWVIPWATREAARQTGENAPLALLLARELGRRHTPPYDLAEEAPPEQIKLDSVQLFLLLVEILVSHLSRKGEGRADSGGTVEGRETRVVDPVLAKRGDDGVPGMGGPVLGNSKVAEPLGGPKEGTLEVKAAIGVAIVIAFYLPHLLFMEMLLESIHVTWQADDRDNTETHYGHEAPGKDIRITVVVYMALELESILVDWGRAAGWKGFPKQGPIPGLTVEWYTGGLDMHGTLSCPAGSEKNSLGNIVTVTKSDGTTVLVCHPKDESDPGKGLFRVDEGEIGVRVAWYSEWAPNFTDTLKDMQGYVQNWVPYWITTWKVSWHEGGNEPPVLWG